MAVTNAAEPGQSDTPHLRRRYHAMSRSASLRRQRVQRFDAEQHGRFTAMT